MKNNLIGIKLFFQTLIGVADNQKLTATEFNTLPAWQNSPVQQIAGSLDDTDIIIDGTKNYETTIVEAGATRTITANASGHLQGNNIKQRYQFNVDCTLTLVNFDTTGNNTGTITPIPAGTYDFKCLANRNGRNLEIAQNIAAEASPKTELNTWYVNGNVVASGDGGSSTPFKTLQEAVDVAASGDTINVRNYDSDEIVTISVSALIFEGPNRPFAGGVQIGGTFECSNANTKLVFKDIAAWLLFTVSGSGVYNSLEFSDCWVKTRSLIASPSAKIYLNDCYYEPTSITAGRLFIYNVAMVGDITLTIQHLSNQSYTIGNVAGTSDSEMVNSTIFGNLTADTLDNKNSVITGTEDISGTTTTQTQAKETIKIPLGPRGTDHTTGTNKMGIHIDWDFYLEEVNLEFDPIETNAGPTGSSFIVDINVADIDGANLATILSTKLSVDAGGYHSSTAATPAVISTNEIAQYEFISIDIDQIGITLAGQAGFVTLIGHRI